MLWVEGEISSCFFFLKCEKSRVSWAPDDVTCQLFTSENLTEETNKVQRSV